METVKDAISAVRARRAEMNVPPSKKAQMIIVSKNCPSEMLTAADVGVKVHVYEGNNMELGALCGKPFSVSALAVIDKGTSNILTL